MKELLLLVTTYNRPKALARLLGQIERQAWQLEQYRLKLRVVVFDDASTKPLPDIHDPVAVVHSPFNHGKRRYWEWVNVMLRHVKTRRKSVAYVMVLPDDVVLARNFFKQAIDQYKAISVKDRRLTCLSLLSDDRIHAPNWTGVHPKPVQLHGCTAIRTQWVDMAFIATITLFDVLRYQLRPVNMRWEQYPDHGSGVGHQMSTRLHKARRTMYHAIPSLLAHGDNQSVMNPKARKRNPLISTIDPP